MTNKTPTHGPGKIRGVVAAMARRLALALAVVLLPAAWGTPSAHAGVQISARASLSAKVALLPLRGPYAAKLRAALATRMGTSAAVLPVSTSDKVLRRLGGVPRSGRGWSTLGRRLAGASTVVGAVSAGSLWRVTLVVRRGGAGAITGTLVWEDIEPLRLMAAVLDEAPRRIMTLLIRPDRNRVTRRPGGGGGDDRVLAALMMGMTSRHPAR